MSFKKIFSFLLKVAITFITFYYIFDKLISDKFSLNINIFYSKTILFLSLIILISYCLISLRLYIITQYKINYTDLLKINIISSFFSNLNSAGSEVIRILMLRKKVKLISSFTYVFCDRLIGLISKVVLIITALFFLLKLNLILILLFVLLITFLSKILFSKILPFIIKYINTFGIFKKYKIDKKKFLEISKIRVFSSVFLISFTCHFLQVIFIYLISIYFAKNLEFLYTMIIGPFVMAISSIPISIGGWGVRELTMIQGYNFFNVQADTALRISITIGIMNLLISFIFTIMILIIQFFKDLLKINEKI